MHFTEPNIEVTEEDLKALEEQLEFNSVNYRIDLSTKAENILISEGKNELEDIDSLLEDQILRDRRKFLEGYAAANFDRKVRVKIEDGAKVRLKKKFLGFGGPEDECKITHSYKESFTLENLNNNEKLKIKYKELDFCNLSEIEEYLEFLKE